METDNKRPNAAIISREWFEAANNVLGSDDLGSLLLGAVKYVLNGKEPTWLIGTPAAVFAMIKPALDSDIAKYNERCARRAQETSHGDGQ